MVLNDGSDGIAPSCSSRVQQCSWTLCNTHCQHNRRVRSCGQSSGKQATCWQPRLLRVDARLWLSAVQNCLSQSVFRITHCDEEPLSAETRPAHFDEPGQLILFWLQCDLRSTFAHKLLIPGTLEHWMNQQREYFCLLIKEKSKTWTLSSSSSSSSTLSSRSRTCFTNVCTMFLMFPRHSVDWFQKTKPLYCSGMCMVKENDVTGCSEAIVTLSDYWVKHMWMLFVQWRVESEHITTYWYANIKHLCVFPNILFFSIFAIFYKAKMQARQMYIILHMLWLLCKL